MSLTSSSIIHTSTSSTIDNSSYSHHHLPHSSQHRWLPLHRHNHLQKHFQFESNQLHSHLHNHLDHHISTFTPIIFLKQSPSKNKSKLTKFACITILKRYPSTLGTSASTNIKLKRHKKYVLLFKYAQTSFITHSTTSSKSSFSTSTTTTNPQPTRRYQIPLTKNPLLNTPPPSLAKKRSPKNTIVFLVVMGSRGKG